MDPVYLDYAATTPVRDEVRAAMTPALTGLFGNPSSIHRWGREAREALEQAREELAAALGASASEVTFVRGGTESDNLALLGWCVARRDRGEEPTVVISAVEHHAVLEAADQAERTGLARVLRLAVDPSGAVDLDQLRLTLGGGPTLVSVMWVNNECGMVLPLNEIGSIVAEAGATLHSDAAQAVGKVPVDVGDTPVHLVSGTGHKVYAPKGIGALYIRPPLKPEKFCHGAGQERGWRAGTENVLEIVGLGKACEIAVRDLQQNMAHMQRLRDRLHKGLAIELTDVRLNGHSVKRLPNTLSLSFKGVEANRILEEIGLKVAASAGAACHSDTVEISHVLESMNVPLEWAKGTLRFSVGRMTTAEEIDKAIEFVTRAVKKLRIEKP